MKLKIGLCQINVVKDKIENLKNAEKLIRQANDKGARIICLPEIFNGLYHNEAFIYNAEKEGDVSYKLLSNLARELEVYIVGGSISEKEGDKLYNTSYSFNPNGELIGKHRKVHLFDIDVPGKIQFFESDTFTAGDDITVIDTEYGKFAVAICFDIRFPELFRMMAKEDVKGIFVPGAFNMTTGPAHWELSFRARAVDNQVFMFGCAPARGNNGYISYGNSMAVNPWGDILGRLDEKQNVLIQEIELDDVEKYRNNLPIIKNMRRDLY